jgi:hypothetical protein
MSYRKGVTKAGGIAAAEFFDELTDEVETLAGIARQYNEQVLANLMYLQVAILSNNYIELYSDEPVTAQFIELLGKLSSSERWKKYVQIVNDSITVVTTGDQS